MSNIHQVLNKTQQAELHRGCHPYHPGWQTAYGYVPSEGAGIVFCALFAVSMFAHIVQFSWKRTWWMCVFPVGCLGMKVLDNAMLFWMLISSLVELLGWAARTWSSRCVYNQNAFLMQISTLIIGESHILSLREPSLISILISSHILHGWHLHSTWPLYSNIRPRVLHPIPEGIPLDFLYL